MPSSITPDKLTLIGLAGAFVSLAGYAIAARDLSGLWLASLGYVINWFGDSLDGTLARFRKIERPRYGYFLDNSIDAVQQFVITVGIGLSGLVRWDLCFLALAGFFMMSILTLVRSQVSNVYHLTYGGVGPTELRVFGIALNTFIVFFPPARSDWFGWPMNYVDVVSLTWSISMVVTATLTLIVTLRQLAVEDPPR